MSDSTRRAMSTIQGVGEWVVLDIPARQVYYSLDNPEGQVDARLLSVLVETVRDLSSLTGTTARSDARIAELETEKQQLLQKVSRVLSDNRSLRRDLDELSRSKLCAACRKRIDVIDRQAENIPALWNDMLQDSVLGPIFEKEKRIFEQESF